MSLDFFADLATTGTVLGLDHTSDRSTVRAILGDGETSIPHLDSFGLIEFGWYTRHDRESVAYLGAQTHRLEWLVDDGLLESALVEQYSEFTPGSTSTTCSRRAVSAAFRSSNGRPSTSAMSATGRRSRGSARSPSPTPRRPAGIRPAPS